MPMKAIAFRSHMDMVYQIGKGYYGVEASGRAIAPAVLARMNQAYTDAISISKQDIVIKQYGKKQATSLRAGRSSVPKNIRKG